jgi:MFS family permease
MAVTAVVVAGYATLGVSSPIAILAVLFFIQGTAMGIAMPAATSAVMDVLPRERAGAGSALTNTARQVAVALGTAVLGSILANAYRSHLGPVLSQLHSPALAGAAGQSITATQGVAQQLGAAGRFLLDPASIAFVDSMRIATIVGALVSLGGALVVLRWMPGKPEVNMDEIIAAEIEAAERDLALGSQLAEG